MMLRQDGCADKVQWSTWAAAVRRSRMTDRINREHNDPKRTHVYRCQTCGGIHIGADRPRRSERA